MTPIASKITDSIFICRKTFLLLLTTLTIPFAYANPVVLDLDATPVAKIQPTMYGIFFEDINFSADGGLYAEMVKNRSFEFEQPMMGWKQPATDPYSLNTDSGIANTLNFADNKSNKNVLRVNVHNDKNYNLVNEGFRGMGVIKGDDYLLSFYAQNPALKIKKIIFELVDSQQKVIASTSISPNDKEWQQYSAKLRAKSTEEKAQLKITFQGNGIIDLDMISLFPEKTWGGKAKGLRQDLVQLLFDLKPGFFRFPGGCIIEGRTLAQRYQWKDTLGDVEQRPTMISRWNNEFSHKLTPDYFQSFGLGFYEYFQLAEDLGAEPIPVLNCGIACQFNTGEVVPMSELDPYVQDALDLIEFANGPVDSPWGKIRKDMGHPETFNLKYIGIGNEQWGPQYIERYEAFHRTIKQKYPNIILISGSGPFPAGDQFDFAHRELRKLGTEIIDEHYYQKIEWFKQNATRYDNYDRKGPKIFAGEYAAQSVATVSPENKNSWETALAEAAFMTGLERNADVVHLTSYAPLMAHTDAWQWSPNMIWFNNLQSLATANYQVQKLFATNKGTELLSIGSNGKPLTGQDGLYASAVKDSARAGAADAVIIKLVNTSAMEQAVSINAPFKQEFSATITTLMGKELSSENTFANPRAIYPVVENKSFKPEQLHLSLPAHSVVMLRLAVK